MTVSTLEVPLSRMSGNTDLPVPEYQSRLAAGADLCAACPPENPLLILPGERMLVPTGFAIALPAGYEAQIRPRSGLALKYGITVLNSPGTIDADYRGEIKVLLINLGQESFEITRGQRIAQMVIAPVAKVCFSLAVSLPETLRGKGGFGSTGI